MSCDQNPSVCRGCGSNEVQAGDLGNPPASVKEFIDDFGDVFKMMQEVIEFQIGHYKESLSKAAEKIRTLEQQVVQANDELANERKNSKKLQELLSNQQNKAENYGGAPARETNGWQDENPFFSQNAQIDRSSLSYSSFFKGPSRPQTPTSIFRPQPSQQGVSVMDRLRTPPMSPTNIQKKGLGHPLPGQSPYRAQPKAQMIARNLADQPMMSQSTYQGQVKPQMAQRNYPDHLRTSEQMPTDYKPTMSQSYQGQLKAQIAPTNHHDRVRGEHIPADFKRQGTPIVQQSSFSSGAIQSSQSTSVRAIVSPNYEPVQELARDTQTPDAYSEEPKVTQSSQLSHHSLLRAMSTSSVRTAELNERQPLRPVTPSSNYRNLDDATAREGTPQSQDPKRPLSAQGKNLAYARVRSPCIPYLSTGTPGKTIKRKVTVTLQEENYSQLDHRALMAQHNQANPSQYSATIKKLRGIM